MRLILASSSPYRRALIARLGLACETASPPYEEVQPSSQWDAAALVVENALGKARAVASAVPPGTPTLVIGSDQVAVCDHEVLLKPGTAGRARDQLARLSGREHELLTAVAIVATGGDTSGLLASGLETRRLETHGLVASELETSAREAATSSDPAREAHRLVRNRLRMRRLSTEEIAAYVKRERPLDCAGAYKSEGLGIALFEYLRGDDPTAIVGLPLVALCDLLRQAGLDPLLDEATTPDPARKGEEDR